MGEESRWELLKVDGGQILDRIKELIKEGNVRRIVIRQGDETIAEFPLTVGVVGAVLAPMLAAVGAMTALLTDCTIAVERAGQTAEAHEAVAATGETPQITAP